MYFKCFRRGHSSIIRSKNLHLGIMNIFFNVVTSDPFQPFHCETSLKLNVQLCMHICWPIRHFSYSNHDTSIQINVGNHNMGTSAIVHIKFNALLVQCTIASGVNSTGYECTIPIYSQSMLIITYVILIDGQWAWS